MRLSKTRLAFVLPAGGRHIELRSNVFVPAHTVADSSDARKLGLCVGRLQVDGREVALDGDKSCASGWSDCEFADRHFRRRWTTGAAALPAGSRVVIVDLTGFGSYWRRPADPMVVLSA